MDKALDLIVNPVTVAEAGLELDSSLNRLSDLLNQINGLLVELSSLVREYVVEVTSGSNNLHQLAEMGFRIAALRDNISDILLNLITLLESLGATFENLPTQDVQYLEWSEVQARLARMPNTLPRLFNFYYLGNDLALRLVRDAFNVLESEYSTLRISLLIIS